MPLRMLRWPAFALIGALAAVNASAGHELDAVALLQRSAAAGFPAERCRPGRPTALPWLQDAERLKKVLDESTVLVKVAANLLRPQQQPAGARRRAEDGAQERATRAALREQIRELLKRFPGLSSATRGVLTGWVMPQLMDLRRSAGPPLQDFIDHIAALDVVGSNAGNIDVKLSQLAAAVQQSGYGDLAANISKAAPLVKKILVSVQEVESLAEKKVGAGKLMRAIANISKGFPLEQPVQDFISDLAQIVDLHPGDLKQLVPTRAVQLLKELNVSVNERTMPTISEMVVVLAPRLMHGELRMTDVMPYVSRLLNDLGFGRDVGALPVVLSFFADVFAMNQKEDVDRNQVLARLAQFLGDLNVFDHVGGPLGALAGLLGDLAKFYEGKGGDPRQMIPRVAKLANELHAFNSTARKGMAAVFGQVAGFTCELSGMRARLAICGGLGRAPGANASVALASRPAPQEAGAEHPGDLPAPPPRQVSERGSEAAGEAIGALLQASAGLEHGGSLAPRRGDRSSLAPDPCNPLELLGSALGRSSGDGSPRTKKPAQSAEEKRREPSTRAALRDQVTALLGHFPAVPSMARGIIASSVVPKIMELRRNSQPSVRSVIDGLAAVDAEALGHIVRDLGGASPGGPGRSGDAAEAAGLLRQVADLARGSAPGSWAPDLLRDLADQLGSGGGWARALGSQAPLLLRRLNVSEAAAPQLLDASRGLQATLERGGLAAALPEAARLINGAGGLGTRARERLAVAVEDGALFLCSLRGMRRHMPLCSVLPRAAEAVDDADDEAATDTIGGSRSGGTTRLPHSAGAPAGARPAAAGLREATPKPKVTWHRKHTQAKPK